MTHHLGYDTNQPRPATNARNGYTQKTVITGDGPLEIRTPRDRDGSFESQLVKKNQTRITGMDNQIISLYAKGMTTREIAAAFKELYDADVSPALVSKVTDAVMEQVVKWQNRHWTQCIPLFISTVSSYKFGKTVASSTNPSSWRWVLISKTRKNCWVCGWPKMKVPGSGLTC